MQRRAASELAGASQSRYNNPAFAEEAPAASSTSEAGEQDVLTPNQLRLLYLVSRYSHPAGAPCEPEQWVRRLPLLVLIYECVASKVLDYDYAPCSVSVEGRRYFLNVSQEGFGDLDALLEGGYVSALRVVTREHEATTCYQVSRRGQALLKRGALDAQGAAAVEDCLTWGGALLQVVWEPPPSSCFLLRNDASSRDSSVMDVEDVSYVASPYLPPSLRPAAAARAQPLSSNAHRAAEAGQASASNIRDELDSAVSLSSLLILVGEWVPMGPNALVELAQKLGTGERVRGGYFAAGATADDVTAPASAPESLARVDVLEAAAARWVNAEAALHFATPDPGLVQVETFGLHVRADGCVLHGLRVEAIGAAVASNFSLDLLARLLTDVHKDSSIILDSLTSAHAADLMDTVFLGDAGSRDKISVFVAARISPKLPAAAYLDRGVYENELRQVLGDLRGAYDLSPADVLLVGANGILLAGPGASAHERSLTAWLLLVARDAFVRNVHARLFVLGDACKGARAVAARPERDPAASDGVRATLQHAVTDVIHLGEVLLALEESLQGDPPQEGHPTEAHADAAATSLHAALRLHDAKEELKARVADMRKIVAALQAETAALRSAVSVVEEAKALRLGEDIADTADEIARALRGFERAGVLLEALAVLLGGLLAFAALDRLTGQWSVVHTAWADAYIVRPLMSKPLVWFALSMLAWAACVLAVGCCVWSVNDSRAARCEFSARVNKPVDLVALDAYVSRKWVHSEGCEATSEGTLLTRLTWRERDARAWGGPPPEVEILVDATHGFLLHVRLQLRRRRSAPATLRPEALKQRLFSELAAAGVLSHAHAAEALHETRAQQETLEARSGRFLDPDAPGRAPPKQPPPSELILRTRLPGDAFHREIPFGLMTWQELRTEVAAKYGVRPRDVQEVYVPPDLLIADDDDVARLAPGTLLEVVLRKRVSRGAAGSWEGAHEVGSEGWSSGGLPTRAPSYASTSSAW